MTETTKPIADWNTTDFRDYLCAEHKRIYGIEYRPFRGWNAEAGIIGDIIGTAKKPRKQSPEMLKAFIDACFAEYKPKPQYPGVNFNWMRTFMTATWQRVEAAALRQAEEEAAPAEADNGADLGDWL